MYFAILFVVSQYLAMDSRINLHVLSLLNKERSRKEFDITKDIVLCGLSDGVLLFLVWYSIYLICQTTSMLLTVVLIICLAIIVLQIVVQFFMLPCEYDTHKSKYIHWVSIAIGVIISVAIFMLLHL